MRLLIRLIIPIWLLLAGIIVFIRLQPFDDSGLHDLILAENCSPPCFMGIQPGITTAAEARDRLEKRGVVYAWLDPSLPINQQIEDVALLRWRWNINRPALLTDTDASLTYNSKTGLVISFGAMGTRLSLGNFLIDLGRPTVGYMSVNINDRDRPTFTHVAGYPQWQAILQSNIQCPMTLKQLWEAPVTLEIANTIGEESRLTPYPAHVQAIMGYAASDFC